MGHGSWGHGCPLLGINGPFFKRSVLSRVLSFERFTLLLWILKVQVVEISDSLNWAFTLLDIFCNFDAIL
ncbi:hypothetical protein QYF36_022867 [Acer negundo]|nr:hypothetical protein QYF36_022867 [Acer negundo]